MEDQLPSYPNSSPSSSARISFSPPSLTSPSSSQSVTASPQFLGVPSLPPELHTTTPSSSASGVESGPRKSSAAAATAAEMSKNKLAAVSLAGSDYNSTRGGGSVGGGGGIGGGGIGGGGIGGGGVDGIQRSPTGHLALQRTSPNSSIHSSSSSGKRQKQRLILMNPNNSGFQSVDSSHLHDVSSVSASFHGTKQTTYSNLSSGCSTSGGSGGTSYFTAGTGGSQRCLSRTVYSITASSHSPPTNLETEQDDERGEKSIQGNGRLKFEGRMVSGTRSSSGTSTRTNEPETSSNLRTKHDPLSNNPKSHPSVLLHSALSCDSPRHLFSPFPHVPNNTSATSPLSDCSSNVASSSPTQNSPCSAPPLNDCSPIPRVRISHQASSPSFSHTGALQYVHADHHQQHQNLSTSLNLKKSLPSDFESKPSPEQQLLPMLPSSPRLPPKGGETLMEGGEKPYVINFPGGDSTAADYRTICEEGGQRGAACDITEVRNPQQPLTSQPLTERCHRAFYRGCQGVFLLGLLTGLSLLASAAIFHRNHRNHLQVLVYIGALLASVSSVLLVIFCAAHRTTLKKIEQRNLLAGGHYYKPEQVQQSTSPSKCFQQSTSPTKCFQQSTSPSKCFKQPTSHKCYHKSTSPHKCLKQSTSSPCPHRSPQHAISGTSPSFNGLQFSNQDHRLQSHRCAPFPAADHIGHSHRCGGPYQHYCASQQHLDSRKYSGHQRDQSTVVPGSMQPLLQHHINKQHCMSCPKVSQPLQLGYFKQEHSPLQRHASVSPHTSTRPNPGDPERYISGPDDAPQQARYLLSPHHYPLVRSDSAPHYNQLLEQRSQIHRHTHSSSDHALAVQNYQSSLNAGQHKVSPVIHGKTSPYQNLPPIPITLDPYYLAVPRNHHNSPQSSYSSQSLASHSSSLREGKATSPSCGWDVPSSQYGRQMMPLPSGMNDFFITDTVREENNQGFPRSGAHIESQRERKKTNTSGNITFPCGTPAPSTSSRKQDRKSGSGYSGDSVQGSSNRMETITADPHNLNLTTFSERKGGSVRLSREHKLQRAQLRHQFSLPHEQTYVNTVPNIKEAFIVRCNDKLAHNVTSTHDCDN